MKPSIRAVALGLVMAAAVTLPSTGGAQQPVSEEEMRIAISVSTMLQSARTVIAQNQDLINDPDRGDKGLTGEVVLARATEIYESATGTGVPDIDPGSYEGRLLRALKDAVVAVVDGNQATINAEGIGFKGFIPATFARLVSEEFGRRAGDEAAMKVTAPPELIRNRQARPDDWEAAAIRDHLLSAEWPRGQAHAGVDDNVEGASVRVMVPEYYAASCLSCHGGPKGEMDITGYPKEGASEGDLGGIISIRLLPQ